MNIKAQDYYKHTFKFLKEHKHYVLTALRECKHAFLVMINVVQY
jgi:hypothetical protein